MWCEECVEQRIDGSVLQWFGHIERMGNSRITKVWEGVCLGRRQLGRPRKMCIGAVNALKNRDGCFPSKENGA